MKKNVSLILISLVIVAQCAMAGTPLVEFISMPNSNQKIKPQNTNILFYTLRNNTRINFPLHYSLSSNAASIRLLGNTCGHVIAAQSTCVLPIEYHAGSSNLDEQLTITINYQGRSPLISVVNVSVDSGIACELINGAYSQTPFCQDRYQKILQYSPNVFNVSNQHVQDEQTLGGVFGVYLNQNSVEQICYVRCGLRSLSQAAPDENTLFELASVTKTLTTSIFGKLIAQNTIAPTDAVSSYLPTQPQPFNLGTNELPVTFQQLATFSGGVCFSDAPGVDQGPNPNQTTNQIAFVNSIDALNPDPSAPCPGGTPNKQPEYGVPHYLPSHNFYSNSSVGLLGQALMTIQNYEVLETGFNNWMCHNVINVLNMTHTNGCLPNDAISGSCNPADCTFQNQWSQSEYAQGYHVDQSNYHAGLPFPFLPWAPAGGIRSNASDMVNFIRANLNISTSPQQADLIAGMQLAHQPNDYLPAVGQAKLNIGSQSPIIGPQGYAWVCMPSPTNGDTLCGKIGGHTNFRSFLGINKTKTYGVIILFNTGALKTNGSLVPYASVPSIGQIGSDLLENVA